METQDSFMSLEGSTYLKSMTCGLQFIDNNNLCIVIQISWFSFAFLWSFSSLLTTPRTLKHFHHIHPFLTHIQTTDGRGANLLTRSNFGFSIFLKYTSTCSRGSRGFEPAAR